MWSGEVRDDWGWTLLHEVAHIGAGQHIIKVSPVLPTAPTMAAFILHYLHGKDKRIFPKGCLYKIKRVT